MNKFAQLRAQADKVNKTYDASVVRRAPVIHVKRIPTGSLALDAACGVNADGSGGIPVGHGTCFVGWNSSGKTTGCLRVCANLQRLCARCYRPCVDFNVQRMMMDGQPVMAVVGSDPDGKPIEKPYYEITGRCSCFKDGLWSPSQPDFKGSAAEKKAQQAEWAAHLLKLSENSFEAASIVYIDQENTLDLKWGARSGLISFVLDKDYGPCPVASFVHVVPTNAEQAIDISDEYIKTGVVDLIVIDSIAAMVPKEETEVSTEEWQRGLHARLINKACRKWVSSVAEIANRPKDPRPVTTLYVQQWRKTMSAFAENVMPGGNGQMFAYSVIIEFYTSEKKMANDDVVGLGEGKNKAETLQSLRVNFTNRKNKTWGPGKTGSFEFALVDTDEQKAGQVLEDGYLMGVALQNDVIKKEGSKYKFRGKDYPTQAAILEEIQKPAARNYLLRELRKVFYANANQA